MLMFWLAWTVLGLLCAKKIRPDRSSMTKMLAWLVIGGPIVWSVALVLIAYVAYYGRWPGDLS